MKQFDDATWPQIQAANPEASAWVSANAGSGKTKVLTDRVARLLLAGTPPGNILCLTFTKAAAAHMQVRLFEKLGKWALLPESSLRETLYDLGENETTLTPQIIRRARTLFAQALETPGGLKIQTIHAFSSALLRKFPRESGVSPQFNEIDERGAKRLHNAVLEKVATEHPEIFVEVSELAKGGLLDLVEEILAHAKLFEEFKSEGKIWSACDLPENFDLQDLASELFSEQDREMFASLRNAVATNPSPVNNTVLNFIDNVNFDSPGLADASHAEDAFLTKTGAVKKTVLTKLAQKKLSDLHQEEFDCWIIKFSNYRDMKLRAACAQNSIKILRFAKEFLAANEDIKKKESSLDFDDLILKALALLTKKETCDWVMYRLDGKIDHILVDEAQDVNPAQWEIVARLAEEFTAGYGARDQQERTVFAVGDEKQSIFGFQGARPEKFAMMQSHFQRAHEGAERRFRRVELQYSFRSASSILELVDHVFESAEISGAEMNVSHRSFKSEMPGRVDLWPFLEKSSDVDTRAWNIPEIKAAAEGSNAKLASAIAKFISATIRNKTLLPADKGGRPVRPGDFLILVQSRSDLFYAIIRELKKERLPVAGTDRLKIAEELAVKDLSAVLAFLATPSDDYSLACLLKSPLCGVTESQLYSLAHGRKSKFLWEVLGEHREDFCEIVEMLEDLLSRASSSKPYELLEALLTDHGGRKKIISRMGAEVEEAIDAFLMQSIRYEDSEPPTLIGFLEWLAADEMNVKRELDQSGDEIRVMTVHGAKGLESPIVILPQTGSRPVSITKKIFVALGGIPIWKPKSEDMPESVANLRDSYKVSEQQERRRLLYVAMTRAENWLIVCGTGTIDDECWYKMVEDGMSRACANIHEFDELRSAFDSNAPGFRYSNGSWPGFDTSPKAESAPRDETSLPNWASSQATPPELPVRPLPPSGLGGKKTVASDPDLDDAYGGNEGALRQGSFIHLLLEHLPAVETRKRREFAHELRLRIEEELSDDEFEEGLSSSNKMLEDPDLKFLFYGNALAEVAITARPQSLEKKPIYGFIDLLVIESERVLAVDFKSNAVIPKRADEVPESILRQMGAYLESLELIYPGRRAETAILWTKNAKLMPLSRESVIAALGRVADEFADSSYPELSLSS